MRWLVPLASFPVRVLALAALAGGAAAQIGTPPPEFIAKRWVNSPPWTLEELRGKALYVIAFRTWSEECSTAVPALSAKFEKEQKHGLVVIGVTNEPLEVLLPWIRMHRPSYPIVSLEGQEFERSLGVQGDYFPIEAVIDPEGTLIFSTALVRAAAESKLAEALAQATKGPLWPKKLEKATTLLAGGQPDKAYAESRKLATAQLDALETKALDKLTRHIEGLAVATEADSRALLEQGRVYEARERLLPVARCAPPFPNAAKAQELLAAIEAVPSFKDEIKAGQLFVEAYELELVWNYPKAVEQYRAIAKKYAELQIARAVAARLDDLRQRHMLIYMRDCEDCLKAQQACARHVER